MSENTGEQGINRGKDDKSSFSLSVISFAVSLASLLISVITVILVGLWVNLSGTQGSESKFSEVKSSTSLYETSDVRQRAIEKLHQMREATNSRGEGSKSNPKGASEFFNQVVKEEAVEVGDEEVGKVVSVPSKEPPRKVDLSQISDRGSYLDYAGTTIMKLGYNEDGSRKSPREIESDRINFVERITAMGDAFTFKYPAVGEEKAKVVVFSDPTCPYCQRLHGDIEHIQNAGISVHYMMFPRRMVYGYSDPGLQQVLTAFEYAWCSSSPNDALDDIYQNGVNEYAARDCVAENQGRTDFPYSEHYFMAQLSGVSATPITFTDDGRQIVGYVNLSRYLSDVGVR